MFRLKLAGGEEAVFRTIDELALGLQSGAVTAAAEVFDPEAGWLPLSSHPEYPAMVERSRGLIALATSGSELPTFLEPPEVEPGKAPVLHMHSLSGREVEERRRRSFRRRFTIPIVSTVAVAALAIWLSMTGNRPEDSSEAQSAVLQSTPTPAPTPTLTLSGQQDPRNTAPELERRYLAARQTLVRLFSDSVAGLGVTPAFSPGKLTEEDSVRQMRRALENLRKLFDWQRLLRDDLDRAYEDTAAYFSRLDWSQDDILDWQRHGPTPGPSPGDFRADSLLGITARLFWLLEAQAGAVRMDGDSLVFDSDSAAIAYAGLRRRLVRLSAVPGDSFSIALPPLQEALTAVALPPARR